MDVAPLPRIVKIPGQRLSKFATSVLHFHPLHPLPSSSLEPSASPIQVVCVSDTHNKRPELPFGNILIHAGDLTENGSFDEVQSQLTWLSAQPHDYKVVVAGNHDVLLDQKFLEKYPERRYGQTKAADDLDWGDIHYLQDSTLELEFPVTSPHGSAGSKRILRIFGSPRTPQYGISAFQYPRYEDIWSKQIPSNTDIVITHGPPRLHLDTRDVHRAGCPFLAREVARVRPRLVVFGHIHVSYGREDVVLDSVRQHWEQIINQWAGWMSLGFMAAGVLFARLRSAISNKGAMLRAERITTFINASVVSGPHNQLQNQPITCII